jgi:hypothetical protein
LLLHRPTGIPRARVVDEARERDRCDGSMQRSLHFSLLSATSSAQDGLFVPRLACEKRAGVNFFFSFSFRFPFCPHIHGYLVALLYRPGAPMVALGRPSSRGVRAVTRVLCAHGTTNPLLPCFLMLRPIGRTGRTALGSLYFGPFGPCHSAASVLTTSGRCSTSLLATVSSC